MSLLTKRIRGVRVLDMVALGLLISLILSVYLAKTIAGRERTEIALVERQIVAEQERIRLLQAEVSHLERPARIEQLSVGYLGLGPVDAKRETTAEALAAVVRRPEAKPPAVGPAATAEAPAPVAPAEAAQAAAQPASVPHLVQPTPAKRPVL
jgi:cell division protein FtsL